jgi:putative Mn2+ efflux pump MntP
MPIIGYFLGAQFQEMIEAYDHWIAFGLLFLIGANMIREAVWGKEESQDGSLGFKTMLLLAIATSIDALAVGVSFACIRVKLWSSVIVIGLTTFAFSVLGVKIGNVFGSKYEKSAGIIGGIMLILIGLKILLEHLGVIAF